MNTYQFENFPVKIGRYRVDSIVGRGAMGIVYKGFDELIEREIALKFLKLQTESHAQRVDFLMRFKQEAKLAAQCLHPNIITVFDYVDSNDFVFIVMEYVEGLELRELLAQKENLPLAQASEITLQVLQALQFAHERGIVHRDIKPANILILESGHVKVADFGVAKMDNNNLTQEGYMVGTPNYMSPEAKLGHSVDLRSDLYAVGVVLLELITGYKTTIAALGQDDIDHYLSDHIKDGKQKSALLALLSSALNPVLSSRITSATQFASELKRLLTDTGIQLSNQSELAKTMIQAVSTRTQVNPQSLDSLSTGPTFDDKFFSTEMLRELQRALVPHVGPVAKKLVRNYARKVKNFDALVRELSAHIPNESERSGFVRNLSQSTLSDFRSDATDNVGKPPVREKPKQKLLLEASTIKSIEEIMMKSVGPMGALILRKAIKSSSNQEELVSRLSATIPNEQEAASLQETLRTLLVGA